MKKILITGSTGFLGGYLCKKLSRNNKIYKLGHSKKSQYNFDLTKKKLLESVLSKIRPNIVINLVANTDVDNCERYKNKCFKTNVQTVKNLAYYSKKLDFRIIHISTDQLYDANKYNKEHEVKIKNYYAKTKYIADKIVNTSNGCVLRTNFFGYNHSNNKGIVNWILSTNDKIYLYKNMYFSPLYVKTLVKYIEIVTRNFNSGIYNLGSKNKISKSNFIKKIIKKFKLNLNYDEIMYNSRMIKTKAKRPLNMQMNVIKFERKFNIKLPSINKEISKVKINEKF